MRPAIVLPWHFVAQCNHRLMPVLRWIKGKPKAMLITAPEYRLAKQGAEYQIKRQWKGSKLGGNLELRARCYFPDRRKRDSSNYTKMIEDAMSEIVYGDDSQLVKSTWELAGIDRENPRIEITITPLDTNEEAA